MFFISYLEKRSDFQVFSMCIYGVGAQFYAIEFLTTYPICVQSLSHFLLTLYQKHWILEPCRITMSLLLKYK